MLNLSKQTVYKIDYFLSILIIVSFMMHSVSCVWLLIGSSYEYTWITHPQNGIYAVFGEEADRNLLYISAFYWSVTTLATVGYGDIKGFTW